MGCGGIYQIQNQSNGNRYVGSTVNLNKRWAAHLCTLRHRRHDNQHLQRAFDKYGEGAFAFCVIEHIDDALRLIPREQYYLNILKPEYNMAPTAGSSLGYRHTEEARRKMSELWTAKRRQVRREMLEGKAVSNETRGKMSRAWTAERRQAQGDRIRGVALSEETRAKISVAMKGKIVSDATRQKLSEALRGRSLNEETRRKISKARKAYWRRIRAEQSESI